MKLDLLIEKYLSEIKLRHSLGTWRFYISHLGHFATFAKINGVDEVEEVDEALIKNYISSMRLTNENITINKNIGCLKRMFKFMNIEFHFLQTLDKFKERNKTFEMLSENQIKEIRSYVKSMNSSKQNNLYYKAIILLLMDSGARIQEILFIEKKNIDLYNYEILLTHTKTKEDRVVYISEYTSNILKEIMNEKHNHPYVLHNYSKDRQASYNDVVFFLKKLKKILGYKKLHAHMFRHSFATIMINRGADLISLMNIMGHKNLETTQRYLHANKEHTKKMYFNSFNLDN